MPKVKYLKSTLPPVNGVQELFRRGSKAIGGEKVAERLGMQYGSYRMRLYRGRWSNRDLCVWAEALEIGAEELGRAILQK